MSSLAIPKIAANRPPTLPPCLTTYSGGWDGESFEQFLMAVVTQILMEADRAFSLSAIEHYLCVLESWQTYLWSYVETEGGLDFPLAFARAYPEETLAKSHPMLAPIPYLLWRVNESISELRARKPKSLQDDKGFIPYSISIDSDRLQDYEFGSN